MAPKATVRTSGGNPTGFPDYRPINKLPKHEIEAILEAQLRPALAQVWVQCRVGGPIPVGPKVPWGIADNFAAAIRKQVALGREKVWFDPFVVPV